MYIFFTETDQESSELFEKVFRKQRYHFHFDGKWFWGISVKRVSWFSVHGVKFSVQGGKCNVCTVLWLLYLGRVFQFLIKRNGKNGEIFSVSVAMEPIVCWSWKERLNFRVKSWILNFCMLFAKTGSPIIFHSKTGTTRDLRKIFDFSYIV